MYEYLTHHASLVLNTHTHIAIHTESDSIKTIGGTQCLMPHFMLAAFDIEYLDKFVN